MHQYCDPHFRLNACSRHRAIASCGGMRAALLFLLLAAGSAFVNSADAADYSRFTYSMPCTLKTGGLGLGGHVRNYPMLIRLSTTNARTALQTAMAGGADVRFSKSDATPLYYEIEKWSTTAGDSSAAIWVKVDTAYSAGNSSIIMYWGNADSTDKSADSLVFDTATANNGAGFVGAWHFSGADSLMDATTNRFMGTNTATRDTSGVIGRARRCYSGDSSRIEVADNSQMRFASTNDFTLSAWAYVPSLPGAWQGVAAKGRDSPPNHYGIWINDGNSWSFNQLGGSPVAASQWAYITCVQQGSTQRILYCNASNPVTGSIADANGAGNLYIGAATAYYEYFNGIVDEVRIFKTCKDTNWIKLDYQTQLPGATVVAMGPVSRGRCKIWAAASAGNAGVDANWLGGAKPIAGDSIVFNATSVANCTWDLSLDSLRAWNQTSAYTGRVIFQHQYASNDTLKINGTCAINGGYWTHARNTSAQTYHLCVKVGGDFTLGASGAINVDSCGYAKQQGPGYAGQCAGAHGGQGGNQAGGSTSSTYGSPTAPVAIGSGGEGIGTESAGGGAVLFKIAGAAAVNGSISARGHWGLCAGAGGSIFIISASITGSGTICADGGKSRNTPDDGNYDWPGGGGGRVAIYVSSGGFSTISAPTAYSGISIGIARGGGAGTVYLDSTNNSISDGRLVIDNNGQLCSFNDVNTTIPSGDSWTVGSIVIRNRAHFMIPAGATLAATAAGVSVIIAATLDSLINKGTLTIGGTGITNGGTFIRNASTSTVMYTGQTDNSAVTVYATGTYNNLAFNKSGTTFNAAALTVNGDLTITAGTLSSSGNITCAGNWTNSGAYTAGTNTVTMSGVGKTISGSTTFYKFKKIVAAADSLFFTNGTTQTVSDSCVLKGASGQLLKLRSTSPGNQWSLNPVNGKRDIQYVDVKDGKNSDATIISPANSTNSGNTVNWFPPAGPKIWAAAADGNASVGSNWQDGVAPAAGDSIVFIGATSNKRCTWDLTLDSLRAWNQTATYTDTVMFQNQYSTNDSVKINGTCVINGGCWTHKVNGTAQTYRMKVYVGGAFTLASGARISVDSCGWQAQYGPGYVGNGGAAYGGSGSNRSTNTYGSITAPVHLGSGGGGRHGGGAIWLNVAGAATINGPISAFGDGDYNAGGAGSGGSIYLRLGTITGSGTTIRATGGIDTWAGNGGGGRVAVILTGSGADFTNFSKDSIKAYAGEGICACADIGAPGTVYLQTQAQGDNGGELVIRDWRRRDNTYGWSQPYADFTTLNDSTGVNLTVGYVTLKDSAALEIGPDDTLTLSAATGVLTIPSADTVTIKGRLNISGTTPTWTVNGKMNTSGSGILLYTGTGVVTMINATYSKVGVNNASGTFSPPAATLRVTDSLKVLAGTLVQTTNTISAEAFYVGSGATFSNHSTGDIIVGAGGISNAGTLDFDGNGGGCGGNDDISITSSSSGVQRPWSGAGTFTLYDISVTDQEPSSVITAYSSMDAGNNGANWRFCGCTADYSTWAHNHKIFINTTPRGANITTGVRDFPLLVRLNNTNFRFSEAQAGGADLRFTNSSGTDLSYQIERWNAAAESSEIWVRVDTIAPNSATQYVTMYWGKNTAGVSDGAAVFLTSNGFRGVWHLTDTLDATINAMKCTRTSGIADTAGDIAGAQSFNGSTGYMDVASAAPLNVDDTFTVSLWARFTGDLAANGSSRIISRKLDWNDANGFSINRANQTKDSLEILGSSGTQYWVNAINDWTQLNWEHIAVVFTGTKASVYGGGALKGGGPGTITKVVNNSNVLTFGQQAGHNETYWQGQLDEIRLEKAVRSADWIKLCYETQRIGATLSQSGVEIASPGSDFQAGAGTMLSVEIHDLSGAIIASDTSTMITFTPTKHGTITGVTEGTGDGGYGVAAGAETVTVRNGRATILLNDWQADTFAVVITNSAGLPNAAPDTIVVTTAAAPVVTVTPADTTIPEGRPITIIAQVVGSRPLTYRWTVAGSATVLGADSAFEIAAVTAADSGHYICAVTNASGTGADTAVVRVATAPKARFTFAPQNPLAGAAIGFADSSAGSIAQWRWSFGDGTDTTYDARMTAVSHVYSDTGRYVCKLTVIGTLATMRDSITAAVYVSRVGENPVRLEARVLSSTRIELTFKGIKSIPTDPLVSPHADKLYCWFGRSGLSRIDTLPGRKFKEYSIATMLAAMGNDTAYTDIVTVPAPILLSDSIYGFWASPLWNGIRASPFGRYNAVGVRMAPVNNLTVNGQYLGNSGTAANPVLDADKLDSVRVLLGNAGSIDTAGVQSVVIAYRLGSAGPFDIDTLPALDVVQAGAEFAAGKRNPLFMEDTIQLEVSAWLIGKNLQISEPSADTFMVGWPYPANPCSLRVEGRLTANQAPLVWNNPGNVDSVRILYGVGPVPLGQPDEWKYLSLSPSRISDTGLLVIGLEPSTHYYFAIQVRKDLHWSNVTIRSRADVVTPEYGTGDSIDNTIAIDSLWFAQAENALHIRWHAQPLALITRNMGVRISGDSALARNKPPTVFDGCVVSPLSALSGEMTIDMAATIAFNDTLYAGLWLQNTRGPWSQPTDSSFGSFTTPDFTWQRISYFGRNDTVRAFNGTVLVRKDSLYQVPMIVDTVTRYYPPDTIEGLLPLSIGFSLKKENIQSFYVGLRYDSLPSNVDISDLGVYRDSAGRVLVEYAGSVDTASRTVWAFLREQNSRSGGPFFVMADTLRPRIFIVSDTGALVTEGQGITDRFTVRDNIGNVRWRLLYSRDGRPFRPTSPSGYLCGSCDPADTAAASVDGWFVTGDNGLLSLLIVSDGVHTDTVNLSRQARRENADAITTLRNCWTPLSTTTELDNPGVSGVLRSLVPSDRAWVYMPARFRMFQWLVTDENRSDTVPQKWVEYSNRDSASFSFLPGRTRWLKTIEPASFNFGSGRSASLKKAVEVPLNPGEWTDIAVPYHFDVRAADILQATGIAGDSLEIYKWVMDTVPDKVWGGEYATFVTHPLYISGAPDAQISDPAIALTWQPLVAYSVYCWPRRSITLRIPPVSAELSAYQPAAGAFGKARDVGGWSAKVVARTVAGRSLNTVYCGYATGPGAISYHPQPPGFLPLKAGIYDARQQRIYGHGFAHRLENGGLTFAVSFANYGDKVDTILYHVEPGSGFPAGFTARMYDPVTGAFSTMGRDTSLVLRASERVLRILTIGTEAFVSSAAYRTRNGSFALVGCSMNPASNGVLIRYRVPMIGVSVVKFRLYDMSGRQVWRQSIDRRLHAGVNTLAWNGISQTGRRVSTGMYILSMQAYDRNGRITGVGKAAFAFVR